MKGGDNVNNTVVIDSPCEKLICVDKGALEHKLKSY